MIFFQHLLLSFLSLSFAWQSNQNHHIEKGGQVYHIRGVNWFGAEGDCLIVHGLWVHDLDYYFSFLQKNGFNSIRFPFSETAALHLDALIKPECVTQEPLLQNASVRQALHLFMGMAKYYQMSVLLDFHTINGAISESVVDREFSTNEFYNVWTIMLSEFGNYTNLIGIDIKNEPHGHTKWPYWGNFVRQFINHMQKTFPHYDGLFFVEGIEDLDDRSTWGGSFRRMGNYIGYEIDRRIVFSPHVYGVSVRGISALNDGYYRWNQWFGNLLEKFSNAIVIGEIGGYNEDEDHEWHENILQYLQTSGMNDFYYWCLNPNSYDTNGIFYMDWTTVFHNKIDFCARLQPHPTFLSFDVSS